MTLAIISLLIGVLLFELCAWLLFRRKLEGLVFPAMSDGSDLPLFTLQRLRLIAIAHTILLGAAVVLVLLFLW